MRIDPPSIIGPRLKALRLALGFTKQYEFAAEIGVEKNTYNPWEKGKDPKRLLTFEAACKIHDKFGIPLDYLFYGANEDRMPADILLKLREQKRPRKAA